MGGLEYIAPSMSASHRGDSPQDEAGASVLQVNPYDYLAVS